MSETTIDKINTSCLGCHFLESDGEEQTGCSLQLLEKYGDSVVPVYDELDNKFFVINGRFCMYKRSSKWAGGLTLYEARLRASKEIALKVELIIYMVKMDELALTQTIESALARNLPPAGINVINHSGDLTLSAPLGDLLSTFEKPWKIANIVEPEATKARCFDIAIKDSKFSHFLSCDAGYVVPEILDKINEKINWDLEPVSCVSIGGEPPKAIFGQTMLYKILQGNAGDYTFWQKAQEIQKEEKTSLIRRDTEL